jgi:hypothetical protein
VNRDVVEAVDAALERSDDADDVLRDVVAIVHDGVGSVTFVGIAFIEGDDHVLGPSAGAVSGKHESFPISFRGSEVASLEVAGPGLTAADRATLERVVSAIGPYCLVGWDTGGEEWEP